MLKVDKKKKRIQFVVIRWDCLTVTYTICTYIQISDLHSAIVLSQDGFMPNLSTSDRWNLGALFPKDSAEVLKKTQLCLVPHL